MGLVLWSTGRALFITTFLFPDEVPPKPCKGCYYLKQNSVMFKNCFKSQQRGLSITVKAYQDDFVLSELSETTQDTR